MLPPSQQQGYFYETLIFFNKFAIVAPFLVIIGMSFVGIGLVDSAVFNFYAYIFLSILLLLLVALRVACFEPSPRIDKFILGGYLLAGFGIPLFIVGFNTPFTIFWLAILVWGYANFGRPGFLIVSSGLLMTAAVDTFLRAGADLSYYTTSLLYCAFIIIIGYALARVMHLSANSQKALQETKGIEATQRDRLNALLNSMAEGVLTVTTKGTIRMQNASALALLDTNEDLTGRHLGDVLHLTDAANKPVDLKELLKSSSLATKRDDLTHHFGAGDVLRLSIQISPIRTGFRSSGEAGYILLLRDITKEKSLEEERDEFISVVSHELRTPVTIAEGSLSNLMFMQDKGAVKANAVKGAAAAAHEQVLYLAKMINDLSTLSRAERGVGDEPEEIDLNELFIDMYKKYQHDAKAKGLHLNLDVQPKLPKVMQSRLYLEEVLQNFITNAIKYTQEGKVTLHAHATDAGVACTVSDSGIGVSRSDLKKIFQKFYRSEDYRTRETGGTGLGLYVVKKLAAKMGIELTFKSRLNHGSQFGFVLPVKK